jgi:hypothetical protein
MNPGSAAHHGASHSASKTRVKVVVLPHRGIFWMKRKPRDVRARMRHQMEGVSKVC